MSKGSSIHASVALNALHASGFLNSVIRGAICDPSLGKPDNHPNAPFFGEVEWYLTCRQVAHAGDTFNTYCQNILAEILETDTSVWPLVKRHLRAKRPEQAIVSLRIQREVDGCVREALRESLGATWCGEVEIIAELRNRIVHQAGTDPEGKIPEVIRDFPPGKQFLPPAALDPTEFPVSLDASGKLMIDARTGYWATQHVLHHIHLLDQNLCHRFGLARRRRPIRKIGLKFREPSTAFTLPPGTPLPVPRPILNQPAPNLQLPPPSTYGPMATPEEISCTRTWNRVRSDIHEFVRQCCEDAGVDICGQDFTLAGTVLSHTLDGYDQHFGYDLRPSDGVCESSKFLGIRLRQNQFLPFITIWGTHSQMREFHPCELTDQVKDYLQDCIGHTLSH